MRHCRRLFAKLKSLIRPGRADDDLNREVSSHLALLEDEFLRRGALPERPRSGHCMLTVALSKPSSSIGRSALSFGWNRLSPTRATPLEAF